MSRILPIVLALALTIFALVDLLLTERGLVRARALWALLIVGLPVAGPITWLVAGRPRRSRPSGGAGGSWGGGWRPPDDNPEFLRRL